MGTLANSTKKLFWANVAPIMAALCFSPSFVNACDQFGNTGIVEENNLYIPADTKGLYTITHEKFEEILTKVESIYKPIFKAKGKTLVIEKNWDDGTVNAYAQQNGNNWMISMFGGLARHDTITEDAFALVACHEIGHHLGGAPKKKSTFGPISWASNEGQADYWGTMKCLRKYFEKDDNQVAAAKLEMDPYASSKCHENFANAEEIAICERSAMAGLSLGNLFKALRNQTVPLKFETPDKTRVRRTNDNHPDSQCRLDTYFSGSLCEKSHNDPVSDIDANVGVCNERDNQSVGLRPYCWYAPSK